MGIGDSIVSFGESLGARGSQLVSGMAQSAVSQARGLAQNAANNAINAGLSYVPAPLRGVASGAAQSLLGSVGLGGGCVGGSMYCVPEDFNKLRRINKKLVQTEFVHEWDFRLEIEGQPADFDLYIKDISYSGFEIGTDEEKYGIATYTWPTTDQPVRVSFTARDNYDLRIATFITRWAEQVKNNNGTVNLPFGISGYTKKMTIYNIKTSGEEIPLYNLLGYPIQYGDCTRSHENCAFMEMPVTLVSFSTMYCR